MTAQNLIEALVKIYEDTFKEDKDFYWDPIAPDGFSLVEQDKITARSDFCPIYFTLVLKHEETGLFFEVKYNMHGDHCDHYDLDLEISQVTPKEITKTIYEKV